MAMLTKPAINKIKRQNTMLLIKKHWQLYFLLLPTMVYIFIFLYAPMGGVLMAFQNFSPTLGIFGSPWVGFHHFIRFFNSFVFWDVLRNTISLSVFNLLGNFPLPIIFALLLNQLTFKRYQRFVQTVSYAPHFISTVVLVGMLNVFLSPSMGIINIIIGLMGGEPIFFMGRAELFLPIYVLTDMWQHTGRAAIIYIATLAGISPELHEAAMIDGASKFRRVIHIEIPGLIPVATIMLLLSLGQIMNIGFEKAFLMQNNLNIVRSEIISTYVYKVGLLGAQWSFATAVGLFNSLIGFSLVIGVNTLARKFSSTSLW